VFYNFKSGFPLTGDHVYRVFKRFLKKAGIPSSRTIHGLRHAFATNSLSDGVPVKIAQNALGHSTPMVTQQYEHLSKRSMKKYYER